MGNTKEHGKIKNSADTKRIAIEDVAEYKKGLLESLVGIVSLPNDLDIKKERVERRQNDIIDIYHN